VQRKNRHGIQLLVTLVLFVLAATGAWMTSKADAHGLSGPDTSTAMTATRSGVDLVSGDPDAGQGVEPARAPTMKQNRGAMGPRDWARATLGDWIGWAGRIWATLYLRLLR